MKAPCSCGLVLHVNHFSLGGWEDESIAMVTGTGPGGVTVRTEDALSPSVEMVWALM